MGSIRYLLPLLAGLLILCRTAGAADSGGLVRGPTGLVVAVGNGDKLTLRDGTVIRLIGIRVPHGPLGQAPATPWPLAGEARETLRMLTLGKTVTLSYGGTRRDRHGRALAHVYLPDGRWVQGEMLRLGMAQVSSFRDNRAQVAEMLALEQDARANRNGIWALEYYAVKPADGLQPYIDSFQIIEGQVLDAARIGKYTYLNFGADYRTDFTLSVAKRDLPLFEAAGIELPGLVGRKVRARGWLDMRNGPMIVLTHPEQIEILP